MLKIGGQRFPKSLFLLIGLDAVLIVLGLVLATIARLSVSDYGPVADYLYGWRGLFRILLATTVCQLCFYLSDLYDFRLIIARTELLSHLLQAFGVASLALAVCYYFAPSLEFGRGITVLSLPIIFALTLGYRLRVRENPRFGATERMLILGTGATGISLVRDVISRPELQLKVVGFLDERGENIGKSLVNPGIIGGAQDLQAIVQHEKVDHVVVSLLERRGRMPIRQLLHLKFAGVHVEDAHSFFERITGRILLEHLSPSWLIFSDGFRKSAIRVLAKRIMDICLSLVALIVSLPLFAVVAIVIRVDSGSPILFRQERTGLKGRPFWMIKFRSMYKDAEEGGARWATVGDKRITRTGKFIRKYRIDELPQLVHVLRGEMSLVGPRPERPEFVTLLEERIPYYGLRHSVRPGITGWAQVKYQYGGTVEEAKAKLEYDLFYIKHLSVMLDLAVLFETAKVILTGRGAK